MKGLSRVNDVRADPVNDSLPRLADILSFRKEKDFFTHFKALSI